jgi:hypothetical protein
MSGTKLARSEWGYRHHALSILTHNSTAIPLHHPGSRTTLRRGAATQRRADGLGRHGERERGGLQPGLAGDNAIGPEARHAGTGSGAIRRSTVAAMWGRAELTYQTLTEAGFVGCYAVASTIRSTEPTLGHAASESDKFSCFTPHLPGAGRGHARGLALRPVAAGAPP